MVALTVLHNRRVLFGGMILLLAQAACSPDKASFAPLSDPHRLLARVELSDHALNLATAAPYDTVRLHVAALLADGTPAPVTVRFRSAAPDAFTVDSMGLVTAHGAVSGDLGAVGVHLHVSATYAGVTRQDSALVCVVSGNPRRIARVALLATPADSIAIEANNGFGNRSVLDSGGIYDSAGAIIPYTEQTNCVSIQSSDTMVIGNDMLGQFGFPLLNYVLGVKDTGSTWLTMSLFAYGSRFKDSVRVRILPSHEHHVNAIWNPPVPLPDVPQHIAFSPQQLTVEAGADVVFSAPDPDPNTGIGPPIDVTFDDPTNVTAASDIRVATLAECFAEGLYVGCGSNEHGGAGNIPAFHIDYSGAALLGGHEARHFARPGRYPYHSSSGATGAIVVQ